MDGAGLQALTQASTGFSARTTRRVGLMPQLCRRTNTRMAGDQPALLVDQHGHRPPPLEDGGSNFVEVGLAMNPGIVCVRDQPLDRPALDPDVTGDQVLISYCGIYLDNHGKLTKAPRGLTAAALSG